MSTTVERNGSPAYQDRLYANRHRLRRNSEEDLLAELAARDRKIAALWRALAAGLALAMAATIAAKFFGDRFLPQASLAPPPAVSLTLPPEPSARVTATPAVAERRVVEMPAPVPPATVTPPRTVFVRTAEPQKPDRLPPPVPPNPVPDSNPPARPTVQSRITVLRDAPPQPVTPVVSVSRPTAPPLPVRVTAYSPPPCSPPPLWCPQAPYPVTYMACPPITTFCRACPLQCPPRGRIIGRILHRR